MWQGLYRFDNIEIDRHGFPFRIDPIVDVEANNIMAIVFQYTSKTSRGIAESGRGMQMSNEIKSGHVCCYRLVARDGPACGGNVAAG